MKNKLPHNPDNAPEGGSHEATCWADRIRGSLRHTPRWSRPIIGLALGVLGLAFLPVILLWILGDTIMALLFDDHHGIL
jgi:hypothetical protein